jgi:hypothetical protein
MFLNLVHELGKKEQASGGWSLPSIPAARMIATVLHGRRDGAWLHPRSAARRFATAKAKGVGCKRETFTRRSRLEGSLPAKKSGPKAALKGSSVQFFCWPPL